LRVALLNSDGKVPVEEVQRFDKVPNLETGVACTKRCSLRCRKRKCVRVNELHCTREARGCSVHLIAPAASFPDLDARKRGFVPVLSVHRDAFCVLKKLQGLTKLF
jgi:hypothetical protein